MPDLESIKKTLNSASGKALKKYLLSRLLELQSIENIEEFQTTAAQTIEVKAQKRAYMKLKKILSEIMDIEEEAREKDPRDSYDVM